MTLARGMEYADSDPIVEEYSWAFDPDHVQTGGRTDGRLDSTPVEQATAGPGERRAGRLRGR